MTSADAATPTPTPTQTPTQAATPAVRVQSLGRNFGRVPALADVTFDVPVGSVYGLLGPNGAGKTTFFSVCANFLLPTAGSVEVLGIDVRRISKLHGRFSMLPQDAQFQPNVPVLEQLALLARLGGASRADARAEAMKALGRVGLTAEMMRAARTLSHGMLKRMALAQAFIGNPEVIFLDEPTAGLDPQNTAGMHALIRELADGTRTIMISSHNLAEIQALCSHCAILDRGRLVNASPMDELLGSAYRVAMTFSRAVPDQLATELRALDGVHELRPTPAPGLDLMLDLAERNKDAILGDVLAHLTGAGLVPRTLNEGALLEQRFLEMTAHPAPPMPPPGSGFSPPG